MTLQLPRGYGHRPIEPVAPDTSLHAWLAYCEQRRDSYDGATRTYRLPHLTLDEFRHTLDVDALKPATLKRTEPYGLRLPRHFLLARINANPAVRRKLGRHTRPPLPTTYRGTLATDGMSMDARQPSMKVPPLSHTVVLSDVLYLHWKLPTGLFIRTRARVERDTADNVHESATLNLHRKLQRH